MLSERVRQALYDIRDNGNLAQNFISGCSVADLEHNRLVFYAVTRALEIISEAARRLPPEFHERHQELPWRQIMGAGNVYRHNYENVAEEQVWLTVKNYLPSLLEIINQEIMTLDKPS